MSIEILFRGQTRRKGEYVKNVAGKPMDSNWVYGGICIGTGVFSIIYTYDPVDKRVVYTDTVTQYTGLKDKNGTKIFEGDIVKMYLRDDVVVVGDIRYSENACRFEFFEDFLYPYGFDNTTPIEVIGNKFDNNLEVQDE